ncbi:hypothetical protein BVY02_00135 [bacterium J17]|nr:hypothetical protein BVY02_00135 [bacterium J17]
MSTKTKILAFSGSLRKESFNHKLVSVAAGMAQSAGAEVTVLPVDALQMPLFNQDLEAESGLPVAAKTFKKQLISHDAFLISSPEYNSSYTAVLKNAIDWASRTEGDEKGLVAFHGKVAGIISASPGKLGGLRGLFALRTLLGNIGVLVLPDLLAVSSAQSAFDESGQLKDSSEAERLQGLTGKLVEVSSKLAATSS